MPRIQG
ncbi:unnamed protein product [Acanthoscelides obtectus]|nr:unnamed protein product [Acanthoscelides obtectus]CAK1622635.1 hypothetical protein AOBTE_LOCUS1603 [Acanthoscelides obtectus]